MTSTKFLLRINQNEPESKGVSKSCCELRSEIGLGCGVLPISTILTESCERPPKTTT